MLTHNSGRKEVLTFLRESVQLPPDVIRKLDEECTRRNEVVDGEVLLAADEGLLIDIGVPRTVAIKIVRRVKELLLPNTQALAPSTQQALLGDEEAEEQQQRQQGQANGVANGRRRGRSHTPQPDTQATQQQAQQQQPGEVHIKPDPEQWEQQLRQESQQQQQAGVRRSRRQRSQAPPDGEERMEQQPAARRRRSQPPEEEEEEGEQERQVEAQRPRRRRQQAQQQQVKPEPLDEPMGDLHDGKVQEEEQQEMNGLAHEEEGEAEEEEAAAAGSAGRGGRAARSRSRGASAGAAAASQGNVKAEPGVAVQEHSVPLTGTGGRSTRRSSQAAAAAGAAAAAAAAAGTQEQQQLEGGGEDAAGPSGSAPRMTTRRHAQRQEDQQAAAQGRRQMRLTTLQERQRRQEAAAAQSDDEEIEEEEEEGAEEAQQAQQEQQGQQEEGMQVDGEQELEEAEPLVTEDLGPAASKGFYETDWRQRAKWGMFEIFSSMRVEQLRELVETQEEERQDWPEIALNCLRKKKKVDGLSEWVDLTKPATIARRLVNFLFTGDPDGGETEAGGFDKRSMKDLLRDYCDEPVRQYVEEKLKLRYQNVPRTPNYHKLMWHLWHYPVGFAGGAEGDRDVQEFPVLLGKKTLEYVSVKDSNDLEPAVNGFTPWRAVWSAIDSGKLVLEDMEGVSLWLTHLNDLSTHSKCKVAAKLIREAGNRKLIIYIFQLFDSKSPSASMIAGTWKKQNIDTLEDELVAVDLVFLLGALDGLEGTPFLEEMERLTQGFDVSADEIEAKGLDKELALESPMNLKQFDKVISCVEDIERDEPQGFKEQCDEAFNLTLRPYQRRALAHMLREERAQPTASRPGGSARHLWVKLPLPDNPEVTCFVSPILHQIRTSISKIEAEQWVNANGGAGWIALQMGMGKTADAVGAIQMNPPHEGWRKNRAWQSRRARDHLASVINNMPHGGTLVVAPPTLIDQWEDEIIKTTDAELSVLKWTETSKLHHRSEDCREIASYDIVLTTFHLASNLHTLSHIRWWRIIVDEPQLGAGGFLQDKEHVWFANHRWLLTGTPINHAVDTMTPSMEFLKLGTFDALYTYFPPVATHVLKTFMVRYTKKGRLDGEENLALPPITENLVECELNDEDVRWYKSLQRNQKSAFLNIINKLRLDVDMLGADRDPNWEYTGRSKLKNSLLKLRGMINPLRQAATSALKQPTGVEWYDDEKGKYVKETHWHMSKAEAVIEVLEDKNPEEKVLIFSEYPTTLQAIRSMLPSIDLQSRMLTGAGSAATRGKAIRAFQTDPPTKVFLLTYRAGGAGITLTAGTHIILCEPTLNPSFERQAIGRSHRMGQDKPLTVTRLVMKGTIEEKIKEFVERQVEQESDPAEAPESTAMEANLASHDESNKLGVEELRDWIHDTAPGDDDVEEEEEAGEEGEEAEYDDMDD